MPTKTPPQYARMQVASREEARSTRHQYFAHLWPKQSVTKGHCAVVPMIPQLANLSLEVWGLPLSMEHVPKCTRLVLELERPANAQICRTSAGASPGSSSQRRRMSSSKIRSPAMRAGAQQPLALPQQRGRHLQTRQASPLDEPESLPQCLMAGASMAWGCTQVSICDPIVHHTSPSCHAQGAEVGNYLSN